ncbi:MAG: sensor histidine kinase [Janthinobacterium lividum]
MSATRLGLGDIRHTTTFRLTVMFGVVFIVATVALLGLVYGQTARELTARSDRILQGEAQRLLAVPAEKLPRRIAAEVARSDLSVNYVALYSPAGERLVGNVALPADLVPGRPTDDTTQGVARFRRLLAVQTRWGETILIGRDISQICDLRRMILHILFWSGALTAIVGLVSGVALSLRPLRRVQELQAASNRIRHGDLQARMPLAGRNDELDRFAATLNSMIDEVVYALAQARSVTDAVAHDLRTPLARVRSQLYRAQQSSATGAEFQAVAAQAIADLDIVFDRFSALLRISELETGHRRAGFGTTDLGPLVEQVVELYEPLAEDRGQQLHVAAASPASVVADARLLFEAVANLLDNAIKFTPVGGRIDVAIRQDSRGPVIQVSDSGPGIAPEERAAVLQRFYRGRGAAAVPGSGLGLSVVAAICHLHRFSLALDERQPGLVVRLSCFDASEPPR